MSVASPNPKYKEPSPRLTLCLAMDLKGSTTSGLKLSTKKLDRFNLALVDQLGPYLQAVQLEHAVVKFTGDGWLVMSDEQEDAARLSCLAIIMARRFRQDIADETGFRRDQVPAMRLALCWGRDLPVTLVGGQRDFVGNSVRHAVRACQVCHDDEILIDETVRSWISHDFVTSRCDFHHRLSEFPNVKMEEELVLHVLELLKIESVDDDDAPICFVNTLSIIGRTDEADQLANLISGKLMTTVSSNPNVLAQFNELLSSNLDHDTARDVLMDLRKSGLMPDVETYNALIDKADGFDSESRWLQLMREEGLHPNITTYQVLLRKSRSPEEVEYRLSQMREDAVAPDMPVAKLLIGHSPTYEQALRWLDPGTKLDAEAYGLLVAKSNNFETARNLIDLMTTEGLEPSESIFIEAFSKGVLGISADELLKWYLALPYHPTHPMKRAIADYRKAGRVDDALRLSLDYPHTDTALKTIRQHTEKALRYFRAVVQHDPNHPNGAYALGMALLELGDHREAASWLRRAHSLAAPGTRKDELARYLTLLDKVPWPQPAMVKA